MSMIESVKTVIPPRCLPVAQKLYWWTVTHQHLSWVLALPYTGNRVYCPCCGSHFRRFISVRLGNARCPRCASLDRHRLMWFYLQNCTNIFRDRLKVLHFAPEVIIQQRLSECPNLDYTSTDLDSPIAMVRMDITSIPYADNTFDAILCSHVLEHIPDDHAAMSELYRILKPGGWALILVPLDSERAETFEDPTVVDPDERLIHFGQADHVRIYGRDIKDRLECAGFTVRQENYARELDPNLARRYGLLSEVDMFRCTK